ncbi:hypothetical protein MAC_02300 [Metarhizium acridum CQMa 102]|uniref:Aminoglycoside phosphotransferase domain-containing protein n=1 Tax=Metarhizium acridum (strain CQMa 102) TaxID=655827 RepID=E9DXF2_METAQ|nr:uncharacterized protein MAC_02300 [Metarhizium acridum CQMa 102]EFY91710.1 hypothetical protein MAC_02300 [Metarhizium acridum CQMa 102]
MMGGQNCHAEVVFADGVVWLARFRLSSPISPPLEVRDYVLRSEAATMEFLQRHTRIPSPRVFDWACESDPANTVGVGYILMEKLQGTSLDWQRATTAQREKVVRQLADILLEIERHPFDRFGSLVATSAMSGGEVASPAEIQVRGLAQHSTFWCGVDDGPPGPVWKTAAVEEDEKFFLKHADDKGDHIFVNADFDIVGIIDWEWCSTASREEAFSSPCMMWPVATFYDGSNELVEEELLLARVFRERDREDLARCVLDGRKVQRLLFALGPGTSHEDRRTFACLFMGLKRAFDPEHRGKEVKRGGEEEGWEAWRASALVKWAHDGSLKAIKNT